MRVEFDREACEGWFDCAQEWDAFEMQLSEGKADLQNSNEIDDDVFVREVPSGMEQEAKKAAEVCPVDAITIYDDDGDQLIPE